MPSRSLVAKRREVNVWLQRTGWLVRGECSWWFEVEASAHLPLWNLGPLRIMLSLLCLGSINETTEPGWKHICLQHSYWMCKAHCWDQLLRKKVSFQNITAPWQSTRLPKSSDVDVQGDLCCFQAYQHNICLKPLDQRVTLIFKYDYVRNTFH